MHETTHPTRPYTNLELVLYSKGYLHQLTDFLGSEDLTASLVAEVFNQARKTPALHRCTPGSIAHGVARVAALRLNPALPNMVYFIPRSLKQDDGKPELELTLQYGYAGLRELVMRHPAVQDCFTREVCINDRYEPPRTLTTLPLHTFPDRFLPRGRVEGYYAVIQLTNGNWRFLQMSVKEVEAHAKRYVSDLHRAPAWQKGTRPDVADGLVPFDKMALKTCLRMLCNGRDVPMTAEVSEALAGEVVMETTAQAHGSNAQSPRPAAIPMTTGGVTLDTLTGELYGDPEQMAEHLGRETGATTPLKKASVAPEPEPVPPSAQPFFDLEASAAADRALTSQD